MSEAPIHGGESDHSAWEEFKLLVDTTRGYVDIVIKAATIYGAITAGVMALFSNEWVAAADESRVPTTGTLQLGGLLVGFLLALVLLGACFRAYPVAKGMDQRMRGLGLKLQVTPTSHVGVLFLSLIVAIIIFAVSAVAFAAAFIFAVGH